jgi:hypothetical protein
MNSVVRVSPNQTHRRVADEMLVLDVARGRYYSLNEVGARIWELLADPVAVESICCALEHEFDVSPEALVEDVKSHLEQLLSEGLIELVS